MSIWFETVAQAQRRAKERPPTSVYDAFVAGSETGLTRNENLASCHELGFAPHIAGLSQQREMATTVTGGHFWNGLPQG